MRGRGCSLAFCAEILLLPPSHPVSHMLAPWPTNANQSTALCCRSARPRASDGHPRPCSRRWAALLHISTQCPMSTAPPTNVSHGAPWIPFCSTGRRGQDAFGRVRRSVGKYVSCDASPQPHHSSLSALSAVCCCFTPLILIRPIGAAATSTAGGSVSAASQEQTPAAAVPAADSARIKHDWYQVRTEHPHEGCVTLRECVAHAHLLHLRPRRQPMWSSQS